MKVVGSSSRFTTNVRLKDFFFNEEKNDDFNVEIIYFSYWLVPHSSASVASFTREEE